MAADDAVDLSQLGQVKPVVKADLDQARKLEGTGNQLVEQQARSLVGDLAGCGTTQVPR